MFRTIVLTVIILLLVFSISSCSLLTIGWLEGYGLFENYSGWKTVEVPTNTETKSVIKVPDSWQFTVEDGVIYIKDINNEVIAEEVYQGWRKSSYKDNPYDQNANEICINEDYIDFYNLYTAEEILCNNDGPCDVVEYISSDGNIAYVLHIPVYTSEKGFYILAMRIYNEKYDFSTFKKLVKSVRYPNNFSQYAD